MRTEFGSVFVQPDVCNGCGYCVVSCPFGVIDKRVEDGRAFKCTFCYDRQKANLVPACAKTCPTQSIKFGTIEEMERLAGERIAELRVRGYSDAHVYDARGTSVGRTHALSILLGEPESYNFPPSPDVPTVHLRSAWTAALVAAAAGFLILCAAFLL